jgi:D-amino-acid dehydrogenase
VSEREALWRGGAHPVIDDSLLFGLVPLGDRVRVAGSAEVAAYGAQPAEARCDAIVANAGKTFPTLKGAFPRE